ncbi:MAG TPA: hypothetical protein VNZ94_16610 [Xanthobacteraceae bacterium]|nr:hypothetical protein [Xanthobacteraceae bacterium]
MPAETVALLFYFLRNAQSIIDIIRLRVCEWLASGNDTHPCCGCC